MADDSRSDAEPVGPRRPSIRGFAAMSAEKQRMIASLGGRAAHRAGKAHEFTPEEARVAGRKGGEARAAQRVAERHGETAAATPKTVASPKGEVPR